MRGGLLAALTVLVVAAVIAKVAPLPAATLAGAAPGVGDRPGPTPTATAPGLAATATASVTAVSAATASATATSTATATASVTAVPGAVTGAVTRPSAGGACGFALAEQPAAPVGHCTVLEVGDSLGNDLGWGLAREVTAASGLKLVQLDKSSTGLAKPSFYDWPVQLAADLRRYHPQLVLISLGGNDEQGMAVSGAPVPFGTAAWTDAYRTRVGQLVHEASASGAYVLWVGLPIMQPPQYSRGARLLDGIYRTAATSAANATFVSTWSLFANPQGAFQSNATVNGKPAILRQGDGIHYSFAGEDVVATYVLHEMAMIYHVRLTPAQPATITGWR